MFKTLKISFKFWNTYRVNRIIYMCSLMPILKKLVNSNWYKNKLLKILANLISFLIEMFNLFYWKFIYILVLIFIVRIYQTEMVDTFLHILVFLTLIGAFLNTYMFNPLKEKYYALMVMHMDIKDYVRANYYYNLISVLIGLCIFICLLGNRIDMPFYLCFIIPLFVVFIKMIVGAFKLKQYLIKGEVRGENNLSWRNWLVILFFLLVALGLPFLGIVISKKVFLIMFIMSGFLGIYSFVKIHNFKFYDAMYRKILAPLNGQLLEEQQGSERFRKVVLKRIDDHEQFKSKKEGYFYYHELFVLRHQRIFERAVNRQVTFIISVLSLVVALIYFFPSMEVIVNEILLTYLPYFVFVMYFLNLGGRFTETMFMNSDHSMLTYKITRMPKAILSLFWERLKTIVIYNAKPAFFIGLGLELLLLITGGSNNSWNYIILFVSVMAMSVLFSVHYLVTYYIFQPYNQNTEMKNGLYVLVQGLTYLGCFYVSNSRISTTKFGCVMIIFSGCYTLISLGLVRILAPKTFKIRK